MKALVKIGFKGLTIPAKVQKAGLISRSMTGNTNFPAPSPTLAELDAAIAALQVAFQLAIDGGKSFRASMLERETELDFLITQMAAYVQNESDGDAEKIRSAGFEVRSAPSPVAELGSLSNLRATMSQRNGEVSLNWKPLTGAKSYVVEKSADGNNGWVVCNYCTTSYTSIADLPSLAYTWFRVSAIGSAGQSPWSDVVRSLVA